MSKTSQLRIEFEPTPVYFANKKAYEEGWQIICNEGGSRSSKTYSVVQLLIIIASTKPQTRISFVSHSLPHIKRGAYRDFKQIMEQWNLWDDNKFSYSDFIFTFDNGSYIELFGLEDEGKARGPGRDILFINEANLISKPLYDQLAIRTTGTIFLDWNPADFISWVYTVADDPKTKRIHSTYRNNLSNLTDNQIRSIEAFKDLPDDFMWKVYGLGQRGAAKELIYTQWRQGEMPGKGDVFYGLDFGFNHPAVLTKVEHYDGVNYVEECIYQSNLTLTDLIQKIKLFVTDRTPIYADAAEPKSIEEIYRAGLNVKPAVKDVWAGIMKVKSYPLVITPNSKNGMKELSSYKWKKDKEDNIIEEPVKANDDFCFVGDTMITTIRGQVKIKDVLIGDYVLTSKGYKKVLAVHDNGMKQVENYLIDCGTNLISLTCTNNHLVKTGETWTKISKLQSGMMVYLINYLTGKDTSYIQAEDISCSTNTICTKRYGNTLMENVKQDFIYTIKTVIHGIIGLITLKKYQAISIYQSTLKRNLRIKNGINNFTQKVLKLQKHGTNHQKELNGIGNTQKTIISDSKNIGKSNVSNAEKNTQQKQVILNSAIQTARLKHLEQGTSRWERVYDLTIEETHEYFANGLLVHNCDSFRYAIYTHLNAPKFVFIPRDQW